MKVTNQVTAIQPNFWSGCVFHPTDAIEDAWGRRILDRMAKDGAVRYVRIYAMLEDIVYLSEDGTLAYDYRLSDLRLDYLLHCGFTPLIAYAGIPDDIARSTAYKTSVSKNKTRYKGKLFNTSSPKNDALWETVCYEYTRHLAERYGLERVKQWRLQCFNEPDIPEFFLAEKEREDHKARADAYLAMYAAFAKGVSRVSDEIRIGGPVLAHRIPFLQMFLEGVKRDHLKLDFIALHAYGTDPNSLRSGKDVLSVGELIEKLEARLDVIRECGFGDTEISVDEWGASSCGFFNIEEAPQLIFRETEVFASYYVRLIHDIIETGHAPSNLMICLSGQHEMTEDFSGFRNFFTLNFFAKPIYNAFCFASRLGEKRLAVSDLPHHVFTLATKTDNGSYAVLLTYAADDFSETLPVVTETLSFPDGCVGRRVRLFCIDREHTNPYRLCEKTGGTVTDENMSLLREKGNPKPVFDGILGKDAEIQLILSSNATFFAEVL